MKRVFKLGWQDSNLRMMESESIALPLGDSPSFRLILFMNPGLSGFEPPSAGVKVLCLNRLATAHHMIGKSAKRDSNSRPSPWQGDALPLSHSRRYNILTFNMLVILTYHFCFVNTLFFLQIKKIVSKLTFKYLLIHCKYLYIML